MTSLAAQISAAGQSKPARVRKQRTPEAIANWKASIRANTVATYKAAFAHFGRPATTGEIAKYLGYSASQVGRTFQDFMADYVKHVDTLPTSNGKGHFVWEWKHAQE